tara:strand:- start:792 stop:1010 length:219 start_codon:yes stop_codon:yes gene_type:complete
MKDLPLYKKLSVWFTVSVIICFYLFSMGILPGVNLAVPAALVATSFIHLIMFFWILFTSFLPTFADMFGLEW